MIRIASVLLALMLLTGCAGMTVTPMTHNQSVAAVEIAAREAADQATEARLDGFISDDVWVCIKQLSVAVNSALDRSDLTTARATVRSIRRAAREDVNVCAQ